MSNSDGNWDLLRHCKPVVSPNTEFESRVVRKTHWLVLRNTVNGDHIRLNSAATGILWRLDGKTSLEALCESDDPDNAYTSEEICNWLGPLCYSGLVSLGSAAEDERLIAQYKMQKFAQRKGRFGNPLAVKFPLHNPDNWIGAVVNKLPWLFSQWFLVTVLSVIGVAFVAAVANVSTVTQEFLRVAASPTHWWLYALLYPALKAIHEIGHALAIKRFGGAVHETGITFLVLMPIPYVDASDAWLFPSKSQRILVGAAGMIAECTLAAIGLMVFLTVQPGLIRELGFAVFVMGSISTLLFNANPLLKFDGYYILQDWLDIPNLYSRSQAYCKYLMRRYLFKVETASSPVSAVGERRWLFAYGVLATLYRCVITVVIALYLASHLFVLGVALALFALFQLLINPMMKLIKYLRYSSELADIRKKSMVKTAGIACAVTAFVAFMPVPSSTRTEGVVWVPHQAQVFAAQTGVIDALFVEPGASVKRGQQLLRLQAPELQTAKKVLESTLETARIEHRAMQQQNTNKAQSLAADIQSLERELDDLNRRFEQLDIVAGNDGRFVVEDNTLLLGRHVAQGDLLAYVVNKEDLMVKAILPQKRIERLQAGVAQAEVRLADRFGESLSASLTRQTPAALNSLPSPALAYDGNSGIAVASQTDEQLETIERIFHIELALPGEATIAGIGGRAYVTLHHEPESLGKRWWRSTRQLLLKQLTV